MNTQLFVSNIYRTIEILIFVIVVVTKNPAQVMTIYSSGGSVQKVVVSTIDSIKFNRIEMREVSGGTFTAGSTATTISSFSIGKFEITFEEWLDVRNWGMTHGYTDIPAGVNGYNPIPYTPGNPVTWMNWYDIVKWCNAFSEKSHLTPAYYTNALQTIVYRTGQFDINNDAVKWNASGYRLPTECEWEYAARGGNLSQGYVYSGSDNIDDVGWHHSISGDATHTGGLKSANELGIYDMCGNVWEWCWDWYDSSYPSGGSNNPKGPSVTGTERILRGGSFDSGPFTVTERLEKYSPSDGHFGRGFRVVQKQNN